MTLHRASRYTIALALLALPAAASAQAFGLNEIGACALGRGFAVTGAPCDDASSIYWNPGAMPSKSGLSFYGGAAIIALKGDFTRDSSFKRYESNAPTADVPNVFLNYRTGKYALGVGVYVPYGLTSQWSDDFPGRFLAKKASLQTIYVQPNFAYQFTDNWSIGGGPVIGHSTVELIQAIDLSSQVTPAGVTFGQLGIPKYTEFGRATLKGSAMAYGFDVGLHGKFSKDWQVGLRALSQVSFSYDDADATFAQTPTGLDIRGRPIRSCFPAGTPVDALVAGQFTGTGALTAQKVKTKIRHPAQIQVGLGYTGIENTTLSLDYAYVGWKSFNNLSVDFQGPAAGPRTSGGLQQHLLHSPWRRASDAERCSAPSWYCGGDFGGSSRDGDTAAARTGSRARHDRRRTSAVQRPRPRRDVLAHLHARLARPYRRAHTHHDEHPGPRPEQRLLHVEREYLLVQPQGLLLTHARRNQDVTTDYSHPRGRSWRPRCSRRMREQALLARPLDPGRRGHLQELRRHREQHHRRLPERRHQRLHAAAELRAAARHPDGDAVPLRVARWPWLHAADREHPDGRARRRGYGATCDLRAAASVTDILNNVAVPGARVLDPTTASTVASNALTTFILGGKTQVQKALDANPTFVSIWIGNNDVLVAGLSGILVPTPALGQAGIVSTQAQFQTSYDAMISQLTAGAPGLKGVLIGVAQVANLPSMSSGALIASDAAIQAGINAAAGKTVTVDPNCTGSASLVSVPQLSRRSRPTDRTRRSSPVHA